MTNSILPIRRRHDISSVPSQRIIRMSSIYLYVNVIKRQPSFFWAHQCLCNQLSIRQAGFGVAVEFTRCSFSNVANRPQLSLIIFIFVWDLMNCFSWIRRDISWGGNENLRLQGDTHLLIVDYFRFNLLITVCSTTSTVMPCCAKKLSIKYCSTSFELILKL